MNLRIYQFLLCLLLSIGIYSSSIAEQSSIDIAVDSVRTQTGGRILSADTVVQDGKAQHKIKVLMPNGHVKTFFRDIQ